MSNQIIDVKIVDNVFVKLHNLINTGDIVEGHTHNFNHITLLASGKVLMKYDSGEQEFVAPHLIVTTKGKTHQFTALENNTVLCCIHAIRNGDDITDIAAPDLTPEQTYELLKNYPLTQN